MLALAVERRLPDLLIQRSTFVRRVFNFLVLRIDPVHLANFEIPLGQLLLKRGSRRVGLTLVVFVEIDMVVAVGPVRQDNASVRHIHIEVFIHEFFV